MVDKHIQLHKPEQELIETALNHYVAAVTEAIQDSHTLQCVRLALYKERGKLRDLQQKLGITDE